MAPREYRILSLYRFLPLATLEKQSHGSCAGFPNEKHENDSHLDGWDENTLMANPEQHPKLRSLQQELYAELRKHSVRGTLLLAPEGINGTICYPFPSPGTSGANMTTTDSSADGNSSKPCARSASPGASDRVGVQPDHVAIFLKSHPIFGGPNLRTRLSFWKEDSKETNDSFDGKSHKGTRGDSSNISSEANSPRQAFQRLKIKIKPEIVTMGLGRPLHCVNNHRSYSSTASSSSKLDWHRMTSDHVENKTNIPKENKCPKDNSNSTRHFSNQKCNPLLTKGQYVTPSQWDSMCRDPDVLVIDTRNTYEVEIGTFESALDPKTSTFAEFPDWLEKLAGEYDWNVFNDDDAIEGGAKNICTKVTHHNENVMDKNMIDGETSTVPGIDCAKKCPPKAIAMFCTGGIRCEKATSYALQSNLFPKNLPVYHLEGGILSYLDYAKRMKEQERTEPVNTERSEEDRSKSQGVGEDESKEEFKSTFHGECFVFDKRVAVTEGIKPSQNYVSCYGCRGPMEKILLSPIDGDTCEENRRTSEKKGLEPSEYEILSGIPNLPPLRYDRQTQRFYLPGLTCPRCHASTSRESFERFAARRHQMKLAASEGQSHFKDGKEVML